MGQGQFERKLFLSVMLPLRTSLWVVILPSEVLPTASTVLHKQLPRKTRRQLFFPLIAHFPL